MTAVQKVIQYLAMALAVFLAVGLFVGLLGAVGLFSGAFGGDAVLDDIKTYPVSHSITKLDIRIHAADFTIERADTCSVESNLKYLTVEEDNGVLKIRENKRFGASYTDPVLILYLPDDTVWDAVEITTGAGRLTVDTLTTKTLALTLGAGDADIGSLNVASRAEIEGGAGRITVADGVLHNLDLEMGVGRLMLTAVFSGNCELELGIGESNLTVLGEREAYLLAIEKGIGRITVDGTEVTDFGSSGNGKNRIELQGGIGAIYVSFEGSEAT